MKKLYTSFLLLVLFAACMDVPTGNLPDDPMVADFITVWEEFEKNYPEFTMKSINWELCYGIYLPIAQEAETVEELMMDAVFPMLEELKDGHVWMITPDDEFIRTYFPEIQPNYNLTVLRQNYINPKGFTGWSRGVGYCPPDSLPYLSINSWKYDLNMSRVDEFVALCQETPAIIIDVRMNGGGSDMRVPDVTGRFTHTPCTSWLYRYRTGPDYDDCECDTMTNQVMGPLQYDGTVFLLIGEQCASSGEEFILCMMELPDVVLLGDTTFGAIICPEWIDLPNGWTFTCGVWSARTARNEPVEWYGITPDIYVEATEEDFEQGIDPVLEYAISMVENMSQ